MSFVLAEESGPNPEHVIEFIETHSPHYPYCHEYVAFPGPTSNTYPQWVLGSTGWDVALPPSAVGKQFLPE
jgi:hypothetical protein